MNAELKTVLSILSTKEVGFSMYKHSKFNDNRIYYSLYLLFTFLKFCLRDITPINHIGDTKRHHKNIGTSLGFFFLFAECWSIGDPLWDNIPTAQQGYA